MPSGQSSLDPLASTESLTSVGSSYFNSLTSMESYTDLHAFYGFPSAVVSEYVVEELNTSYPATFLQSDYLAQEQPLCVSTYMSA